MDAIFGGAVPRQYIPAVEKGLLEIIDEGVLAGYPVEKIKVTLFDGSYHGRLFGNGVQDCDSLGV